MSGNEEFVQESLVECAENLGLATTIFGNHFVDASRIE